MINRRTLGALGLVTFALLVANIIIGSDHDVLGIVDDILFFGFILCALVLIVLTLTVLGRAAMKRRSTN